jgi:hypothetical protein
MTTINILMICVLQKHMRGGVMNRQSYGSCLKDDGWPIGIGFQPGPVSVRETNASEPTDYAS